MKPLVFRLTVRGIGDWGLGTRGINCWSTKTIVFYVDAVYSSDRDADGTFDYITTNTYTYNSDGKLISRVIDSNPNNILEDGSIKIVRSQVYNYDNDLADGGEGSDYIKGEWGEDTIYGGSGNDSLYGNQNSDRLYGG